MTTDTAMRAMVKSLGTVLREHFTKRDARLDALEHKVAELEARPPALSYKGVWHADTPYRKGQCVTDHGAIWHCERDTMARPMDSRDWIMCVARGKPGKSER